MNEKKELNRGCVMSHGVAFAICIKKYLKAKEKLWKTQLFHHAKI
jgi:hypothetical protein